MRHSLQHSHPAQDMPIYPGARPKSDLLVAATVPKMLNNMISGSPARVNVTGDQPAQNAASAQMDALDDKCSSLDRWQYATALLIKPGCATYGELSCGIVFVVVFRVVILATIFFGTILFDAIEDDAGNALMSRHALYGGLDQVAGRRTPLNDENGLIS